MRLLIKNIGCLVNARAVSERIRGEALGHLPRIYNAYLLVNDGKIASYGEMKDLVQNDLAVNEVFDAENGWVLPSWCDSHTHLVFAESREQEFVAKIKGKTYAEIAAEGGGILNSAKKLQLCSENDLYDRAAKRLDALIKQGTGAIEIKSGYGLTVDAELKMLRVIQRLKQESPIPIKASFLGAHAFPIEFKNNKEGYVKLVIEEMLPAIHRENLADYIDVFCEEGFFSLDQSKRILEAGQRYGLKAKIHANQLSATGAVELGVSMGALSVDHLEIMNEKSIEALAGSDTIGTMLPTAAFFLRMPYQPARQLIDAGSTVALASDFNPGSSPSGNMNFVVALSCIQLKMLPEEAINAATINGAYAMGLGAETGSITTGKRANLILTDQIPSLAYLPYSFGSNLIKRVMVNGKWYNS